MARILGLDLGANSLGWALIDDYGLNDENSEVGLEVLDNNRLIIDGGVRIFPAGYENLGEGEKEKTRNVDRRIARGMRRRYFRRMQRRKKLMSWLKKFGFLPQDVSPSFFTRYNPYQLRKKGLEGPLSPEEFAVALYHLNQRRGFKSNRKAGNLSEKSVLNKGGNGMIGMEDTLKNYDPEKTTFGAYLASLNTKEERQRARYSLRTWYEAEFDKLWEAQMYFHPKGENSPFSVLHDDERVFKITEHAQTPKRKPKMGFGAVKKAEKAKAIYREVKGHKNYVRNEVIFFQRRLKSQKDKVGMCIFEPKSRRCPASHPIAQRFRMLQQVNNLTITCDQPVEGSQLQLFDSGKKVKPKTRKDSPLTDTERQLLVDYLSTHESISMKDLPKVLEIPKEYRDSFKANLSHQAKIKGCATNAAIIQALGRGKRTEEAVNYFNSLPFRDQEQLWRLLYDNDDPDALAQKVQRKYFELNGKNWQFDFDDEQARHFSEIGLEEKYVSLSLKAMNNLLPYMEQGIKYHDACKRFTEDMQAAGKNIKYHHSDVESRKLVLKDKLPLPPDLLNPLVNTALYELRRVVNSIIEKHGRPDIIRIELARDLKKNKDQRKREHDAIRKNEERNAEARERLAKELGKHPLQIKKSDIVKYNLWLECGGSYDSKNGHGTAVCPFTGKPIGISDLFNGKVDIEHIIPFSRSLDDSISNKTLCFKDFNAHVKGNKTPYELFSPGPVKSNDGNIILYEDVLERVKNFPNKKRKKFTQESLIDEEGETFLSRQLNDTRYMSRAASQYLMNICEKVEPITGGITALLRESWGLTSKLDENGEHIKDPNDRAIPFIDNPFLDFDLHESELNKGGKSRLDHRHHFIDAVVLALTERNAIQKISTEIAADENVGVDLKDIKRKLGKRLKGFLKRIPWQRLVPEVKEMMSCIVISFKKDPITKVQGKFHKETIYGLLRDKDGQPLLENGKKVYVFREKLEAMKDSNSVEYIVDEEVRSAVREYLRENGVDVDKSKYSFKVGLLKGLRHPKTGDVMRSARVKVYSETLFSIRSEHPEFKNYNHCYVQNDGNHHAVVYETYDKKGKRKQIGEVVTLLETYRRVREHQRLVKGKITEDVVVKRDNPVGKFLYTLQINDLILVCENEEELEKYRHFDFSDKRKYREIWKKVYRIQKMSQEGRINVRHVSISKLKVKNESGTDVNPGYLEIFTQKYPYAIKLKINPAGYLSSYFNLA